MHRTPQDLADHREQAEHPHHGHHNGTQEAKSRRATRHQANQIVADVKKEDPEYFPTIAAVETLVDHAAAPEQPAPKDDVQKVAVKGSPH